MTKRSLRGTEKKVGKMMEVEFCPAHDRTLCVIGGGPSAAYTLSARTGDIVTVNAGHDWLINQGIVPWACGFLDPHERIADMFTPCNDVFYYVANVVHVNVLWKLQGFKVIFWYPKPTAGKLQIGGGSSMGLRWINLGYVLGYRKFHLHGLDSSFDNISTHAYPDQRDTSSKTDIWIDGYRTRPNFLAQCIDFFNLVNLMNQSDIEPVEFYIHGHGLLQYRWNSGKHEFSKKQHAIADKVRRVII